MCHTISSKPETTFLYDEEGAWLIGQKIFNSSLITKPVYYNKADYVFRTSDVGIEITSGVNEQEIAFNIHVFASYEFLLKVKNKITTGMHVSPIGEACFYNRDDRISVPVAFKRNEVIFFDGYDISVSKLTLLYPYMLNRIMKKYDEEQYKKKLNIHYQDGDGFWQTYKKWFYMLWERFDKRSNQN